MQETGWTPGRVRRGLAKARGEDHGFASGEILGSMCTEPHELAAAANAMFLETNLGDPAHFPGAARLEREVLEDLRQLLHGPKSSQGRYVTGGTEANLLAAYLAREKTGRRTIVLPESGHFSFEKAARILDMELRFVATTDSGHADPAAIEAAVGKDTALIVAVAGTTELGLIDPVERLAAVAARRKIPLHVDAAFGGYLLPFLPAAPPFDFRLAGVSSIGLDPHKLGLATIPGGVLILRDGRDWTRIAVESPYVSTTNQSTLMGTRPGAAVAAAWAVHRRLGRAGFAKQASTCMDNARRLAAGLIERGVDLVALPETTVVTFRLGAPDRAAAALAKLGFRVNVVPRFAALRVVVNPHVTRQVVDKFLRAVEKVQP